MDLERARESQIGVEPASVAPSPLTDFGYNSGQEIGGPDTNSETPFLHEAGLERGAGADQSPPPAVEDANPQQMKVVEEAVADARRMAAEGMAAMQAGPEADSSRFENNFHTTDPALLAIAERHLTETVSGLAGAVPIEVESWPFPWPFEPMLGYVYGGPVRGRTNIHLDPSFFQEPRDQRAVVIVHEANHKYAGTGDHAYNGTSEYCALEPELAVENADSYAAFCKQSDDERRREEDAEKERAAKDAASTYAEAIWTRYQVGDLTLNQSTYLTPEGVEIPVRLVTETVFQWFRTHERGHFDEVVRWLETHEPGTVTCEDGTVIRADLVDVVMWWIS